MTTTTDRAGIQIDTKLAEFLEGEVLTPLGRDVSAFWDGFAKLLADFAPRNRALLEKREELQAKIDAWHKERLGSFRHSLLPHCAPTKQRRSPPAVINGATLTRSVSPSLLTWSFQGQGFLGQSQTGLQRPTGVCWETTKPSADNSRP